MQYKIPEKFNAIDSHTHLNFILGTNYDYLDKDEVARMIECNKKFGITKAGISMPYLKKDVTPKEYQKGNNLILEALDLFDHFFGFCFVDPTDSKAACDEIRRCVRDNKMTGLKLYHQYTIDDPIFTPIFELCQELNCPVLGHAVKGPNPPTLSNAQHFCNVAKRFPGVNFIQAHIGGGGDWEWNLRVLEDSTPNHFIDTSGSVIDVGMIKKTVETMTSDRVLFATDMFVEEGVGKLLAAEFTDEEMQKICHDNIVKLISRKNK